ncbi:MAG: type IV pilus secretin PilQ [Candidatus Methylomirabilales bacterium]
MMERAATPQTLRSAVGFVVGLLMVSWVAMPTMSVLAATEADQGSMPVSNETEAVSASTPPGGMTALSQPAPEAASPPSALPASAGPNRVTRVELLDVRPTSATVVIETDQVVGSYESFSLPDPPRLVIDIPDAVHAVSTVGAAQGPVRDIRASQYKTGPQQVVRIVLDLASSLPYQVQSDPAPFRVLIGEGVVATERSEAVTPSETLAKAEEAPPQVERPAVAETAPLEPLKEEAPAEAEEVAPRAEAPAEPSVPPKGVSEGVPAEPEVDGAAKVEEAPPQVERPAIAEVPPQSLPKAEVLAKAEPLPQAPAPTQEVSVPPPTPAGRVEGVEYRPKDGQAEMLIRTSGQVDFRISEVTTPPGLILDVTGAVIDPAAAKVLDVGQLLGPVQRIRAAQHHLEPDKVVRITADLKGKVRHEVVQTPEGIRLGLKALAAGVQPPALAQAEAKAEAKAEEKPPSAPAPTVAQAPPADVPPPSAPARLSMDFKEADINNLLRIIAEVSGQNIVAGQDVRGKVTVRLVNVPWDQALDNILRINGFGFVQEENVIRVAKLGTLQKEQEQRRKEQQELIRIEEEGVTEPLRTEILRVSYAEPADVVKNLERVKSKRGNISIDKRTASLIIKDTESSIEQMRTLLAELDQPTPQVMIEGRIVNVASSFTRELGVQWGFQRQAGPSTQSRQFVLSQIFGGIGQSVTEGLGPLNLISPGGLISSVPAAVNLPTASGPAGALGITLGRVDNRLSLSVRLSALEREAKARTLSAPRIAALDNEKAVIKSGTDEPLTTVDSTGRTTISFKEALLVLEVTPHVTADRRIRMKVEVTNDQVKERITVAGFENTPVFTRQKADSSLLVDNGATFVIGGLRTSIENVEEQRVPFLGSLPILGWLFRNRTENVRPTTAELLIFITPTIIEETRQARR